MGMVSDNRNDLKRESNSSKITVDDIIKNPQWLKEYTPHL